MDNEEIEKRNHEALEISKPTKLLSTALSDWLLVFGWLYFLVSAIGGIILIANAKKREYVSGGLYDLGEFVTTTNYFNISLGVVGLMTSVIVLLVCIGIARIIEQNIYIINTQNRTA